MIMQMWHSSVDSVVSSYDDISVLGVQVTPGRKGAVSTYIYIYETDFNSDFVIIVPIE